MGMPNMPSYTVGPGPATRNADATGSLSNLIQGRNGGPILRNPAYANISARDPANRVLAQSAFGGRFAQSGFVHERDRHRHHFGRVIGFLGPVFWPYAYDDFIDYTFSPYAYDTFWPYAYDDVFDGIYGAYAPAYSNYASNSDHTAGRTVQVYGNVTGAWVAPAGPATLPAGTQICSGQTEDLTNFPIQRIAQQVQPEQSQQPLLDDLKAATAEALGILQAACPSDLPSTPTARLAAMRSRVEAMLHAARVIDPALRKFYASLSDEQKERFNSLDTETLGTTENQQSDPAQLCSGEAQAINVPPNAPIDQALRLSDAQEMNLNALKEASTKARDILKTSCPTEPTLTPTARLAQIQRRLEAMMQALDTVQSALVNFYGALDDEQRARFNRFGARPL
jgi:hypothetical protein